MNTQDFDNREKPKQLIAAALAVLITGLIVGAFEPMINQLVPSAEAKAMAAHKAAPKVVRMAPMVVTAKRI